MASIIKRSKKVPVVDNVVESSLSTPKKRAKKPIKVVAVVTPDGIEGSFNMEPRRSLIAHLQVHSNEIQFNSSIAEPEPYNSTIDNNFAGLNQECLTAEPPVTKEVHVAEIRPMQCYSKMELMVSFKESIKAKVLPTNTDISCFWCSHGFDTQPCIIPEREVHGVYRVYGNFCCPQCAMAYLLNETIDPHARWERIALLHRIYDRYCTGRIFPAPPRQSLKIFGGPLTIEAYRSTIHQGKVRIDSYMPPMVSIIGSIDTKPIDFFDSSLKNTLMGTLQIEKTIKAEEGLRLKRSKPLKDRESTLDSVMSIQIKGMSRK